MRYSLRSASGGFTLIELLVVIGIISVLSSIVLVNLNGVRGKARDSVRLSDIRQISLALQLFFDKNGRYPDAIDGVDVLGECVGAPCGVSNSLETAIASYMTTVPRDPRHDCNDSTGTDVAETCAGDYFYGYDYTHAVNVLGSCDADPEFVGDTLTGGVVLTINRLETLTNQRKDVCVGQDMNVDDSAYNILLCANGTGSVCFQNL